MMQLVLMAVTMWRHRLNGHTPPPCTENGIHGTQGCAHGWCLGRLVDAENEERRGERADHMLHDVHDWMMMLLLEFMRTHAVRRSRCGVRWQRIGRHDEWAARGRMSWQQK